MRIFAAVELEPGLREGVQEVENAIRETGADVKLVEPGNLHFTVKFLGEVPDERVKGVGDALCEAVSGFSRFRISIRGFGYFGSPRYVRTLWLDVKEGREAFLELVKTVGERLNDVRKEQHAANVHLTVGRVRSARNREQLLREIERLKDVKIGEMVVKDVKLKKSVLTGEGPVYSDVRVCKLKGPD